jgi:nitrogen fixation NifU-like protein
MDYEAILARQDTLRYRQKIVDADFSSEGDNPFCGDSVTFAGHLDENDLITDIGFMGYACAICDVTSDLLADYVLGKSRAQVMLLEPSFMETLLETDLPLMRKRCAYLPLETLQKALSRA